MDWFIIIIGAFGVFFLVSMTSHFLDMSAHYQAVEDCSNECEELVGVDAFDKSKFRNPGCTCYWWENETYKHQEMKKDG